MCYIIERRAGKCSRPFWYLDRTCCEAGFGDATFMCMRRALGFLIVLWGLSHYFGQALHDLEAAASASLRMVTTAAVVGEAKLSKL